MSEFHDWYEDGTEENAGFAPEAPDRLAVWRCRKCGWKVNSMIGGPSPAADSKYYRKLPHFEAEWYNCEEVIAFQIMER